MGRIVTAFSALIFLLFQAGSTLAETRLVMFEEQGCVWCAKWRKDIGGVYPKTAEGRAAPLLVLDIHDPIPAGFHLKNKAHYTPTFVLMVDGVEQGRIIGYPGEAFFWGLLEKMLSDVNPLANES